MTLFIASGVTTTANHHHTFKSALHESRKYVRRVKIATQTEMVSKCYLVISATMVKFSVGDAVRLVMLAVL